MATATTSENETLGPADKTLQLRTPGTLKNRVQKTRARLANVLGITMLLAVAGSAGYISTNKKESSKDAPASSVNPIKQADSTNSPSAVSVQTQENPEVTAPTATASKEETVGPETENSEPDDTEKKAKAAPSANVTPVAPPVKPRPRPRPNSGGIIREVPF